MSGFKLNPADWIAIAAIIVVMCGGGLTVAYNLTDRLARIEQHLLGVDSQLAQIQAHMSSAECPKVSARLGLAESLTN